jgi:molybdate transport system substrate-binding protein
VISFPRTAVRTLAVATSLLLVAACGGRSSETAAPGSSVTSARTASLTVFAAASLTWAFTQIGSDFEARTEIPVTFNFGSSATLATQIIQGAPADVFAAASPATMKTVTDTRVAGRPVNFASNTLQIAVPDGNRDAGQGGCR